MKPPVFWSNPPQAPGWQAQLLAPLSALYSAATARRVQKPGYKSKVPVICVGNINAGGTGKTPTVIALCQHLQSKDIDVHVVSRGYGGSAEGPLKVNEREHDAALVGDEPLLVSAFTSVWVAKDRAEGVKAAEQAGAGAIILDDGMQNPQVQKDLQIIVVDANIGFGNGRVLPAGPLREPVDAGMTRGDFLLSIGAPDAQEKLSTIWGDEISIPREKAELAPLQMGMDWEGLPVLAFAGIGYPEKFFQTLKNLGADILHAEALGDHQPLTPALMKRLEIDAAARGAQLVTTEKDAVRLPRAFRMKVLTLPVRLELESWADIDAALSRIGLD